MWYIFEPIVEIDLFPVLGTVHSSLFPSSILSLVPVSLGRGRSVLQVHNSLARWHQSSLSVECRHVGGVCGGGGGVEKVRGDPSPATG